MADTTGTRPTETRSARAPAPWMIAVGFGLLVLAGLLWAKWIPYWIKVPSVAGSGSLGKSIVTGGTPAPPGVSLSAGLSFAGTYFLAIWPALVVGLVLAAAVQAVLPASWLRRVFADSGLRGAALSVPAMMCSCCAAPVAVGLRRKAAGTVATLAFWLGNPALNPVVLAFCAFVLPWPWVVLRAAAGVVVVAGAVGIGRWQARRDPLSATVDAEVAADATNQVDEPAPDTRSLSKRFLTALGSLSIRLLPEYLLIVVALGALRGVLFPLGSPLVTGSSVTVIVVGVVVLAVAGTLLPIPTGAEVAVIAAMLAVGVAGPVAAVLLITLPTISLPSLLMVRRAFPRRLLAAITGLVVAVGLLTSAVALAVGL